MSRDVSVADGAGLSGFGRPERSRSRPEGRRALLDSPGPTARWEWLGLATILALFFVMGVSLILENAPLGHDEAVYALRARYFAGEHSSMGYWADYRAPGLPLLMRLSWPLGGTDGSLRLVVLLTSVGGIAVTWVWARRWFGARAGLLAAALLAMMPWYLRTGTRIYVDAPGATFGVAAVAVLAMSIGPERVGRWAVLSVPLAALATLTRYGAPTMVAGGLTVIVVAHPRQMLRSWRLVTAVGAGCASAVAMILLVPAVTNSRRAPLNAFRARQDAKGIGAFASYGDFNHYWPDVLGGFLGWIAAVGLLLAIGNVAVRGVARLRVAVLLAVLILSYVLLNAGLAQGFPQYLVPLLPFLAITAAAGSASLLDRLAPGLVLLVVFSVLAIGAAPVYRAGREAVDVQHSSFDDLKRASEEIARLGDGDCLVVTSYAPQVGWYSRCLTITFPQYATPDGLESQVRSHLACLEGDLTTGAPVFWLLGERGKRQPAADVEESLREMTRGIEISVGKPGSGKLGLIEVGKLGEYGDLTDPVDGEPLTTCPPSAR